MALGIRLTEFLTLSEDFFHSHARHQDSDLSFNDTLDDVLQEGGRVVPLCVRVCEQHGVFHEGVTTVLLSVDTAGLSARFGIGTAGVDIGTDSEDDREKELQLLLGHGLQVHCIVMRLDTGQSS